MALNHEVNISCAALLLTDEDWAAGEAWYPNALDTAREMDGSTQGVVGAGVIAALSPHVRWDKNLEAAEDLFGGVKPNGIWPANVEKANRILLGEHPLDVLGGPKTRSFYMNIVGFKQRVTVDRHALAVALGRTPTDKERRRISDSVRAYNEIQEAYQREAFSWGVEPRTLQAAVWVAWRNE